MAKSTTGGPTKGTTKTPTTTETKARRAPARPKTPKKTANAPIAVASDHAIMEPVAVSQAAVVAAASFAVERPIHAADLNPEEVRRKAYEIYVNRGGSTGSEIEDWLEAERQLRNRTALNGR